jgi:3-isopropylmalate/(R)-2-methylmalate dehydratase small subunit
MHPITRFRSRLVQLPLDDIDTDQIIPARFLKTTDKAGLGESLFADWRYLPDGSPDPAFVLNQPGARGAGILLAGNNFGCGSSREHAPWALLGYGFRAVISTDFADIFRNNALKNGLIPVEVGSGEHRRLLELAASGAEVEVDVEARGLSLPDGTTVSFPLAPFARYCLLNGVDQLGYLLSAEAEIARFEATHPVWMDTRAPEAA